MSIVKDKFIELYKTAPLLVHSPGRINMIGEHTDYNGGFVMPAAIDKGIELALAFSETGHSQMYSVKYDETVYVDLGNPAIMAKPAWANYLLGVLKKLQNDGAQIGNFNVVFDGDLPTGAGLSSSAAVECAFCFGLNELFSLNLSKIDIIKSAQWAEHNYVGVMCGIMDQFTSVMGRKNQVMTLDCRSLEYEYFPLELGDHTLVLCDSNVKHSLASSEYNTRRKECETGVSVMSQKYPEVKTLRDASLAMLDEHKNKLDKKVYDRCLYVIEEIERVQSGSKDLKNGDIQAFGQKMFATHEGLSKLYEVSCPELDFLVEKAKTYPGVIGSRLMGVGFGGCTLNIVRKDVINTFVSDLKKEYQQRFEIEMSHYLVQTGNGSSVLERPSVLAN